jgi:flagellar motor protein MotB
MGRNPWDEIDPDLARMKGSSGGMSWGKVFVGLIVIAVVTLFGAYYVPLHRAHATLSREHQKISDKAQSLDQQLVSAQRSMQSMESKLKGLESEQDARASGSAKSAAEADGVRSTLATALDRHVKKGGVAVGKEGSDVVVALADTLLFAPKKLDVSGGGRALLCEIAKSSGSTSALIVRALDAGEAPAEPLAAKFPTVWALRSARAASIAETLADKCGVKPARLSASAAGGRPSNTASTLPPEHIEVYVRSSDSPL